MEIKHEVSILQFIAICLTLYPTLILPLQRGGNKT